MAGHAKLSASQAKRWMNCPGSVRLIDSLPHGKGRGSNFYSRQGTAAHSLLSACLSASADKGWELRFHPVSQVDRVEVCVFPDELGGHGVVRPKGSPTAEDPPGCTLFLVDFEMAEAVQVAYDHVRDLLNQYPWAQLRYDVRANLDAYGDDLGGTYDVVVDAWPEALFVIDYKHGGGVMVEVEGNEQCRSYALGEASLSGFTHQEVHTGIVQPRKPHSDGPVRYEKLTMDELVSWGEEMRVARTIVDDPDAPLKAGSHCRFCDASGRCPEQFRVVEEEAKLDFAEAPDGSPIATVLTLADAERLLLWESPTKALFKSAKAVVLGALYNGEALEHWKLVQGKEGNRQWSGADEAIAATLAQESGVAVEEFFEPRTLKSPAQVEKLGKPAKDAVKKHSPTVITRPAGKITMAHMSSPKPAIDASASAEFPAYEDDDE